MHSIIAFTEAKAHLSELLDRVSRGDEFIITRHNESVAKLIPVQKTSFTEIKETVEQLRKLRKGTRIGIEEIITWKKKGQR